MRQHDEKAESREHAWERLRPDDAVTVDAEDVLLVAEMALYRLLSLEGCSQKSEATYWSDGGVARLRLAAHDVVYGESDCAVCVGVGWADADFRLDVGMTSARIRQIIAEAVTHYRKRQSEDGD